MYFCKNMLIYLLFSALLAAFAGCASLDEPEEESVPLDISLTQLEAKMFEAADPGRVFQKAKSFVQRQIVTAGRQKNIVQVQYLAPDKYKIETLEDNKVRTATILNGSNAWQADYKNKTVTALSPEMVSRMKTMFDLNNPNASYQSLFASVQLAQCRIGDREFYKMTCHSKQKNLPPLIIYIGKHNYMIHEIQIPAPVDYRTVIKKYALYEGVMIPQETEITTGNLQSTSKIFENKLNVPLDKNLFLPPVF